MNALEIMALARQAMAPAENERLEFLGDAVLEFVVTEELYRRRRDWTEAELAQARESIVQAKALERAGKRAGLERVFREESAGAWELADAVEALVGAAYLERGIGAVRVLILDLLRPEVERAIAGRVERHPKSVLLELVQARWRIQPEYRVVAEGGGETIVEVVAGPVTASGRGRNRREAETAAARGALGQLAGGLAQETS